MLDRLPNEILSEQVFSHLDARDHARARAVCKNSSAVPAITNPLMRHFNAPVGQLKGKLESPASVSFDGTPLTRIAAKDQLCGVGQEFQGKLTIIDGGAVLSHNATLTLVSIVNKTEYNHIIVIGETGSVITISSLLDSNFAVVIDSQITIRSRSPGT
jgi:hypothetical protein